MSGNLQLYWACLPEGLRARAGAPRFEQRREAFRNAAAGDLSRERNGVTTETPDHHGSVRHLHRRPMTLSCQIVIVVDRPNAAIAAVFCDASGATVSSRPQR